MRSWSVLGMGPRTLWITTGTASDSGLTRMCPHSAVVSEGLVQQVSDYKYNI